MVSINGCNKGEDEETANTVEWQQQWQLLETVLQNNAFITAWFGWVNWWLVVWVAELLPIQSFCVFDIMIVGILWLISPRFAVAGFLMQLSAMHYPKKRSILGKPTRVKRWVGSILADQDSGCFKQAIVTLSVGYRAAVEGSGGLPPMMRECHSSLKILDLRAVQHTILVPVFQLLKDLTSLGSKLSSLMMSTTEAKWTPQVKQMCWPCANCPQILSICWQNQLTNGPKFVTLSLILLELCTTTVIDEPAVSCAQENLFSQQTLPKLKYVQSVGESICSEHPFPCKNGMSFMPVFDILIFFSLYHALLAWDFIHFSFFVLILVWDWPISYRYEIFE